MIQNRKIQLLPDDLQNQIAAGEVVERPASVIKELIENALDAGATRIHIQIRDGGQSLIRVSDNGYGIPADQLELALTRHATSKLETIEDLHRIQSFGFRGEALPSIASVSRFRLSSAQVTGDGAVIEVLHGRLIRQDHVAMPQGTDIEISDLFFNIPARLKFLKQPATETRKCADIVARMALANRHVDFELSQGDRTLFHFPAGQNLGDRLAAIWPASMASNCVEFSIHLNGLHVSGILGDPSTAQARPDRIYLYVNRRPVQDKTMLSAVREAYRGRILGKEYPQAVIFLEIPADEVDVNVHPAKTEVRFQDESLIFRCIRKAVLTNLEPKSCDAMPGVDPSSVYSVASSPAQASLRLPVQTETIPNTPSVHENESLYVSNVPKFATTKNAEALFASTFCESDDLRPAKSSTITVPPQITRLGAFQYLGQIDKTYLVLSSPDGMHLIDQHAAHERVLFDLLRDKGARGERQPLLMPLEIRLHPSQTHIIQDVWTKLHELGFSLELQTEQLLVLNAAPPLLSPAKAKEFLEDVLADKPKSMDDLWATMACKSAIKAGDQLDSAEALHLLEAWLRLPDRHHCPHGRPTEIHWSVRELEKLFKRRP